MRHHKSPALGACDRTNLQDESFTLRSHARYVVEMAVGDRVLVTRPAPEHHPLFPSVEHAQPRERLTAQERAVFQVLVEHPGRVMSRQELARRAGLSALSERRCDSLIVGIRRSVGSDRVRTVRRRGWILVP
ncbi:MAG: helix-turn-helix domain-containing protein [Ilumatobacteraceae bacterium]